MPCERAVRVASVLGARAAGLLVAAGFGAAALVRRTKPLHSVGGACAATWQVTRPAGLGVPLLDVPGRRRVLVRLSRAASFSRQGWDVMGAAVRVGGAAADGGDADLLFATTGTGRWTRFLLRPQPAWGVGDYTTLLPLAWRNGSVVLRLRARSVTDYDLLVRVVAADAPRPIGWRVVGRLSLDHTPAADQPLRFRPVACPPLGLTVPAWIAAVRQPAYVTARRLAPLEDRAAASVRRRRVRGGGQQRPREGDHHEDRPRPDELSGRVPRPG